MTDLAVENPEIPEVLDMETGMHVTLAAVVGTDRDKTIRRRMDIAKALIQERPLYVCAECYVPVKLLAHHESGRFYFKHTFEDERCSAVTRGQLSQAEINARKYNGAKESWRHIRMKAMLEESLRADPNFTEIKQEKRWTGKITGNWRQPDIQAFYSDNDGYGGVRIAFEVQLSTTFLDVIAERRHFYEGERGLLFWIFAEFPETGRRLTQDDVFYNNNQNAFIVDEASTTASVALAEFHLTCIWAEPGSDEFQRKLVSFRELRLDPAKQQAFYYDYYGSKETLKQKALQETAPLREKFEAAWIAWVTEDVDINEVWDTFYREFRARGVPLPFHSWGIHPILLNALYSVKHGRVIGWRRRTLVEVAHLIAGGHKEYLQFFRRALKIYGRAEQLGREDKSGKWRARVARYKSEINSGDPKYTPDLKHYKLLQFLFPELFADI